MPIEPWRRRNIEHGLRVLRSVIADLRLADFKRERELSATTGRTVHIGPSTSVLFLEDVLTWTAAALLDEPDNYEKLHDLPDTFIAEFQGRTVRCRKAEHFHIGRGWMITVEGVERIVGDHELSNPRREEA